MDTLPPPRTPYCLCCFSFVQQLVAMVLLSSSMFGFNLAALNTSMHSIIIEFGWCAGKNQIDCSTATNFSGVVSAAVFVGAAIGGLTSGICMPNGRNWTLRVAWLIYGLGIVSSVIASSFPTLAWGRFLSGIAVGMTSFGVPMYIAEISPSEKRGFLVAMNNIGVTFGIAIATFIGLPTVPIPDDDNDLLTWDYPQFNKIWWRAIIGLSVIPLILGLYMLNYTYPYETPNFYMEQGEEEKARVMLQYINETDDVEELIDSIKEGMAVSAQAAADGITVWSALKDPEYRFAMFAGVLVVAFFQLSGLNVFTTQSNMLFHDAGLPGKWVIVASICITLLNCGMSIPPAFIIDSVGRRTMLLTGAIGQTLSLLPGAICYWVDEDAQVTQYIAIVSALLFIVFFALSFGPVAFVYLFEIFPPEIKGMAAGYSMSIHWIIAIFIIYSNVYVSNKISYTMFAAFNGLAIVYVYFMVLETKGRSLEDSPFFPKRNARKRLEAKMAESGSDDTSLDLESVQDF